MAPALASWALIARTSVAVATQFSREAKTVAAGVEAIKAQCVLLHAQTNAIALTSLF